MADNTVSYGVHVNNSEDTIHYTGIEQSGKWMASDKSPVSNHWSGRSQMCKGRGLEWSVG